MASPSSRMHETAVEIDDGNWKRDLNEALKKCNWEGIEGLIRERRESEAFKVRLNDNGDTLLLRAFKGGKKGLLLTNRLVDKITTPDLLAKSDKYGNTALHLAASVGLVEHARKLVGKNHRLLKIRNGEGLLPIQLALDRDIANARGMTSYLLGVMKEDVGAADARLVMQSLVKAGFYDLALKLLDHNPELKWKERVKVLMQMASDQSNFPSGCRFGGWKSLIYSLTYIYVPTDQTGNGMTESPYAVYKMLLWKVVTKVLVNEDIHELKLKRHYAILLLKSLCSKIPKLTSFQASSMLRQPFLLGAQNGIEEIIKEILDHHPTAINFTDEDERSVFHIAVMYRHEKILKIAHAKNMELKRMCVRTIDKYGNNILHMVGYKPLQAGIDTVRSGAIFPMQNELQWFKKVTQLVGPQEANSENNLQKKPFALFQEEHEKMADKEEAWMRGIANASSVTASLVATVAFAAAFQIPGGNNDDGTPKFFHELFYKVFTLFSILALLTSITSVLCFLSIFTSGFGIHDYLRSLPFRVIIGLISLILSLIFLMVAFSSTILLVNAQKNVTFLIEMIMICCTPILLYSKLQPLPLHAMIKSTFCPSILRPWYVEQYYCN